MALTLPATLESMIPPQPSKVDDTSGSKPSRHDPVPWTKGDVETFLHTHHIEIVHEGAYDGSGWKWEIAECPFNSDHKDGDAAVFWLGTGKLGFRCQHDSCSQYDWKDFRGFYDPQYAARHLHSASRNGFGKNGSNAPKETPPSDSTRFALSDLGNAERLVAQHGRTMRWCAVLKTWFIWNGKYWQRDESGHVERWAQSTVRTIYAEAEREPVDAQRKALARWAIQSESRIRLNAMIELAKTQHTIAVHPSAFDRDPTLFNCANGTIDLATGTLREHRHADLITKIAGAPYDPSAACPTFMAFIRRIMNNRQDLISFIQRAGGYSLTGDVSERIFFVLWGTGKNGKSTLLEILSDVLGDYARTTPPETLMVKPDGAIPHDVARLAGALFVSSSEGEESKRLGVAFIKRATGNERMTARELFCPIFEFAPEFKIWFATNHKPVIKDTTESIWDRVKLIPLDVRIPEHERDPRLRKKLQCELPGILAWLVAGCLDWQKHGIGEPEAIQKATAGYRAEMDTAGTFIEENCILGTENMIPAKQLQAAYAEWCAARGKEYRPSDLASKLKEVGCESKRKSKAFFWLGIGIVDPDALEPDEPSPAENDPMIPNDPKFEDLAHEGQNDEKNPENEIIEDQGSYAAETEGRHYEF